MEQINQISVRNLKKSYGMKNYLKFHINTVHEHKKL